MPDQLRWLSMRIWQWVVEESGQDLMEYALLVVLASLVAITIQENIAAALATAFTKVSTTLA
jgi:Flp pilus assembly pilin Flp